MNKDPLDIINPPKEEVDETVEEQDILHRVVEAILDDNNLETKTDLTDKMIAAFAKVDVYAELFNIPILKVFKKSFLKLRISRNRLGRKELTDMTRTLVSYETAPEETSVFSKMFKGSKDL